jgi:glycosyltransferase involved in cell wall biosynthesis
MPHSFSSEPIDLGEPFAKYRYVRRLFQERRYGRKLVDRLARFEPDAVISANTPLDAQAMAQRWAGRNGIPFIFWLQDLYSVAIDRMLWERLRWAGRVAARRFELLERRTLRGSNAVIAVTEDFVPVLKRWKVEASRIRVIENWAPLREVRPTPRDNPWAREHGLTKGLVFMYAGTLGLKHDPSALLDLAAELPTATIVVISEGPGAVWLREYGGGRSNLQVLPFEPFSRMSEVLGSADVLVALLQSDAGTFSVPSKVLTSLAAGRPILAQMPLANLAAKTITRAGAGITVAAGDRIGFIAAARLMVESAEMREKWGRAARDYAVAHFDIDAITSQFEEALLDATGNGGHQSKTGDSIPL